MQVEHHLMAITVPNNGNKKKVSVGHISQVLGSAKGD